MTNGQHAWARRASRWALALAFLIPARAAATTPCGSATAHSVAARAEPWPAPLDRRISLHIRDLPLRDALDRLAATAHLRFSYNDELLPLDRQVCESFENVAVGDALAELLKGARVTP